LAGDPHLAAIFYCQFITPKPAVPSAAQYSPAGHLQSIDIGLAEVLTVREVVPKVLQTISLIGYRQGHLQGSSNTGPSYKRCRIGPWQPRAFMAS